MFKGLELAQGKYDLAEGDFQLEECNAVRESFNRIFEERGSDLHIESDFSICHYAPDYLSEDDRSSTEIRRDSYVNPFFFFPSHKLYLWDGSEKEFGIRSCFIRSKSKSAGFKYSFFDVTLERYRKHKKWFAEADLGNKLRFEDAFKSYYDAYMKVFELAVRGLESKQKIVYTEQTGWVEAQNKWFFVPVSLAEANELVYSKALKLKYKMDFPKDWDEQKTLEQAFFMLNSSDRRLTLPLFSYTLLSTLTSLIDYRDDEFPKFSICLFGDHRHLSRQSCANLFCNMYDRRSNIASLNSMYHLKALADKRLLEKKTAKIRDGIFIVDADKRKKIADRAINMVQNEESDCMLLLLNDKMLDKEYVLNIDMSDKEIYADQIQLLRQQPEIMSACIHYVTENLRQSYSYKHKAGRKRLEKEFRGLYKKFRALLEDENIPQDSDRLHMNACLLVGFGLFIDFADSITDEEDSEKIRNCWDEAVHLFKNECKIEEMESAYAQELEEVLDSGREQHILFLETLLKMLPEEPSGIEEKDENLEIKAWKDREHDGILWVRNSVFREILQDTDKEFETLNERQKTKTVTQYKTDIYQQLRSYESPVILPKNDDAINTKITIGTTEKDDYVGTKGKRTRTACKVFRMDYKQARAVLQSGE